MNGPLSAPSQRFPYLTAESSSWRLVVSVFLLCSSSASRKRWTFTPCFLRSAYPIESRSLAVCLLHHASPVPAAWWDLSLYNLRKVGAEGLMSILRLVMMQVSTAAMSSKSYGHQAKVLVKEYLLTEPFIPYISVLGSIFLWKMVYDLMRLLSLRCIKTYPSLTKIQQIDWNNRGMSSIHAFYIAGMSLYLLCFSDLFSGSGPGGLVVFRRSVLSNCALGVSVGYFIVDLAMILWLYPSLGGMEYVVHHFLSVCAISHSVCSGEGQFYTFLVLLSEITTPGINLRWFLHTAGLKRSPAYLINGVAAFFAWMGARILLFVYLFYHLYLHHDQVVQMSILTYVIVISVPSVLAIMNLVWFLKIVRGVKKTLAKRQ